MADQKIDKDTPIDLFENKLLDVIDTQKEYQVTKNSICTTSF